MRIYMGFRLGGLCYVYSWDAANPGKPEKLDLRLDLWSHSETGFEWGFMGSGPAQLALALAADALADGPRAVLVHQSLKRKLAGLLPRDCWSLTRDQVCDLVTECEKERAARERREHGDC